jgi:branched-chain amino acid transport system ATP-binding protein
MTALLEVSDVSVRFGGLVALDAISVEVRAGQAVGLIGPNGAGKTTLFNVISGLQRPTSGRVALDGVDITTLPAAARARVGIRRSFQNLGLMRDQSVSTNVSAGLHVEAAYRCLDPVVRPWRWARGEHLIRRSVATQLAGLGLAEQSDQRVADLSFGAARFVELASILVANPRLLLLDEPTTGLDLGERDRLRLMLQARPKDQTLLLIAHDAAFVMDLCDWVYVLAGGRMLFAGRPEAVRQEPSVVEAYLGKATV